MELPKDPMMLFSFINMKLRDCYSSLNIVLSIISSGKFIAIISFSGVPFSDRN